MTDPDEWIPLIEQTPFDGAQVLVCWGNCAVMVAYISEGRWRSSLQVAGPNGLCTNVDLESAPTHWRPLPESPREFWDGGMDHPLWSTDYRKRPDQQSRPLRSLDDLLDWVSDRTMSTEWASGPVNINQQVRFKIRPRGFEVYDAHYRSFGIKPPPLKQDAEGYCEMQLWDMFHVFGPAMVMGMDPPIETHIIIEPMT